MVARVGEDQIQAMGEALAHAKGEGPTILHEPVDPREVRMQVKLTQMTPTSQPGCEVKQWAVDEKRAGQSSWIRSRFQRGTGKTL